MANIELTKEEMMTLKEVLENDIIVLRRQLAHTDHRTFREVVRHKEQILGKIVFQLSQKNPDEILVA